jgi:hypothetical protein
MSTHPRKDGPTRRRFTGALAVAAAAPLLLGPAAAQADEPQAAALALTEILRLRHGRDLSDEQLQRIAQSILRARHAADRLRRVPLANGDEPAVSFTADVP